MMKILNKRIVCFCILMLICLGIVYSYELIGNYSIGGEELTFRAFRTTGTNDMYRCITDNIIGILSDNNNIILKEFKSPREIPNFNVNDGIGSVAEVFRRSGGNLLVLLVVDGNNVTFFIYYLNDRRCNIYEVNFLLI